MRSTFKLTLAALAVSLVLTGCKSGQGPSVVAQQADQQITKLTHEQSSNSSDNKTEAGTSDKPVNNAQLGNNTTSIPTASTTSVVKETETNTIQPGNNKTLKPTNTLLPAVPEKEVIVPTPSNSTEIAHEDSQGKTWRVIPLSRNGELVDTSENRRDNITHHLSDDDSPLNNSDEFGDNEYNHFLTFELGQSKQSSAFVKTLNQKGDNYLGSHSGTYQDKKIVGNSNNIHYLYVNQPYSSYGALFTDADNSSLFHVQLSTGRDGSRASTEEVGKGSNYAEYGVYTLNGKTAKWNTNLVGDATYKGNVIARIEKQINGDNVASQPQLDGNVTLNLHLDNKWESSSLSGVINSNTVGQINLNKTTLAPAIYMTERIGFSGEAESKANPDFSGDYSVELVGPNLEDAVGSVELENIADDIKDNDVTKYNAVFGAIKTAK